MPKSRWLSPLFWLSAAPSFLGAALWLRGFDNIAGWLALLIAWPFGALIGWIVTALFLWRFPNAKYLSRDKSDKSDCVWNSADVLVPYLLLGAVFVVGLLASHFSSYRRPDHPFLPRINRALEDGSWCYNRSINSRAQRA